MFGTTGDSVIQFIDFADSTMPYFYHCHNLAHEDGGMMAQFIVVDTASHPTSIHPPVQANQIDVYPNPADNRLRVSWHSGALASNITIYDNLGRKIKSISIANNSQNNIDISTNDLVPGLYNLHFMNTSAEFTVKKFLVVR